MKTTTIRIKKKDLEELFRRSQASKVESPQQVDEKPELNSKIKLFLSKSEIEFLQDIIGNIEGDTTQEKSFINNIKHGLSDCLINS